jgi:hypothetical protein
MPDLAPGPLVAAIQLLHLSQKGLSTRGDSVLTQVLILDCGKIGVEHIQASSPFFNTFVPSTHA